MSPSPLLAGVCAYYTDRILEHGPTPRGVDWNGVESQEIRFAQLLRVGDPSGRLVLGDYGCGYGALYDYLLRHGPACVYRGYDISEAMIEAARRRHGGDDRARFSADEGVLADCDCVVASGVLNVKLATPLPEWQAYVLRTIDRLAELGRHGFAFNALTSYSDRERMRPDLYYADPCALFDYCKQRFSRHVALLHDYGLYEFTILVRR